MRGGLIAALLAGGEQAWLCHASALVVIEIDEDGHKTELAFEEDRARDRHFVGLGLRVMRVTERALKDESVLRQEVRRAARIVR
jgi:very-short-patch-repair endonuclease